MKLNILLESVTILVILKMVEFLHSWVGYFNLGKIYKNSCIEGNVYLIAII